ncbi:MobA/MobL family protein [Xanthomonas rydalmerensis]|uniref:MobA/MobL family protein n=1 Tax=Xanthomonas rydalmerensis TaxID=3046274 RepID=A0ABZ0JH47_9XANT|nr:MobA/MobL family protein [Xanthomonas sp. DM-2023]WOS39129.1 MobA/MobL family protein [Xanthomonas sp. DM-2023]WOS43312.1 MobA/MobL family protein [Xanthomonas sp. DM-2023]WOS47491.1 MobA/MobL family protein [Xanthomonas sp. DM-2023]WOS51672.1 MobA/MobL family protein [Xanthomonas sp. DM-2023]WOS55854.1 MobA/MobL family protein [Xanthomonas sp. DM-2023]
MAIYHANVKTFSRAKGHSSIAAAAYRAGLLLEDEKTGQRHDYRRRDGVVETRCVAPEDAPDWALVPAALWPAAEAAERRKDATIAREFEFALPHELDDEQRSELALEVTRALVSRYRFAAQASIHSPGSKDGLNWHVHVLATTRRVGPEGFTEKTKELDGGPLGRAEVHWVRELIATTVNAYLEAAGLGIQVDHRRLEAQANDALARGDLVAAAVLSREPTKHVGKNATAMARRGQASERVEANRRIEERNEEAFQELAASFESEGRALEVPDGHSHEQAKRERLRLGALLRLSLARGEGDIEVRRNIEINAQRLGLLEESAPGAPPPESLSIPVLVAELSQEWAALRHEGVARALHATRQLLAWAAERAAAFVEHTRFDADVLELAWRLRGFKASLTRFARHLRAERRASKLLHLAERYWENFTFSNPKPGTPWTEQHWKQRRAWRLSIVEKRRAELAKARARVTPEQKAICEKAAAERAHHLEAWSQEMLRRYPLELDRPLVLGSQDAQPTALYDPPAPDLAPSGPRPPRPRFH